MKDESVCLESEIVVYVSTVPEASLQYQENPKISIADFVGTHFDTILSLYSICSVGVLK